MPSKPKGHSALKKKQKDRADLKSGDIVWIGIAATEQNIQRLGAFLMFADYHKEEKPLGPLPYNDPFEAAPPPELEVDWTAVRNAIVKTMKELTDSKGILIGKASIIEAIKLFGGTRLSDVPQDNLVPLLNYLNALNKENA